MKNTLKIKNILLCFLFTVAVYECYGQEEDDLSADDLFDELLSDDEFDDFPADDSEVTSSDSDVADDFEMLKEDTGMDDSFEDFFVDSEQSSDGETFEAGEEERALLKIASIVSNKMSDEQWESLTADSNVTTYTVQDGDWLFKISKKLFGSGFYYPKIWALNPYIKNPHEIEPGMELAFESGRGDAPPDVLLAEAGLSPDKASSWFQEKQELRESGAYVGFANQQDADSLQKYLQQVKNNEYKKYSPPEYDMPVVVEGEYDELGFAPTEKERVKFKEGFHINTFITNSDLVDHGYVAAAIDESNNLGLTKHIFLNLDDDVEIRDGQMFSLYEKKDKVSHKLSDRSGREFTVTADIRIIGRVEDRWKAEVTRSYTKVHRGARITDHTPAIEKIFQTYNPRLVEAMIIGHFDRNKVLISVGDVVYLDRGKTDGVEIGNVFEVHGFLDRATQRKIATQPAYKTGEVVVVSITDNFATALVIESKMDFTLGDVAVTLTPEKYAEKMREKKALMATDFSRPGQSQGQKKIRADQLNAEMQDQLSQIDLTDEDRKRLQALERDFYAGDKSGEKITSAETAELDNRDLDQVESVKGIEYKDLDAFERQVGRQYLDDSLDNKDNPFGLSEFDVEAVDELLQIEKSREMQREQGVKLRQSGKKR